MRKIGFYIFFILFSVIEVRADVEAVVIEVRKNTNLHKKDKIYKNFFINEGANIGLQLGSHVDVTRRLPVHDPLKYSSIGDLRVKVGTLEIIHVESKISVARLVSFDSMEKRPILDYEAIMVGDRLDLESIKTAPAVVQEASETEVQKSSSVVGPENEKVALLKGQSRAESLIQEGERELASLKMKTKTARVKKSNPRTPAQGLLNSSKSKIKQIGKLTLKKN